MSNEILIKAADYIEENGWWQGGYLSPDSNAACMLGAIAKVVEPRIISFNDVIILDDGTELDNSDFWYRPDIQAVEACLSEYLELGEYQTIDGWNDEIATNADQVIDALRGAGEACN